MEYYHLPWVHPSLVKVSPMDAHYRWQGTGKYVGVCTTPIAADTEDGGWPACRRSTGSREDDAVSARFVWLYPNIALNVLPNHIFLLLAALRRPGPHARDDLSPHPSGVARRGARNPTSSPR